MSDAAERWQGDFGRDCTRRNTLADDSLDELYVDRFGISRADLNAEFLGHLDVHSVLEVGCNVGMQLRHLRRDPRWSDARMAGVDLQQNALDVARRNLPDADLRQASAAAH